MYISYRGNRHSLELWGIHVSSPPLKSRSPSDRVPNEVSWGGGGVIFSRGESFVTSDRESRGESIICFCDSWSLPTFTWIVCYTLQYSERLLRPQGRTLQRLLRSQARLQKVMIRVAQMHGDLLSLRSHRHAYTGYRRLLAVSSRIRMVHLGIYSMDSIDKHEHRSEEYWYNQMGTIDLLSLRSRRHVWRLQQFTS